MTAPMRLPSRCPNCGEVAEREAYDIGSGPEYSCAACEWCWGALGQALRPLSQCERDWPLIDPNEEDRLAGRRHSCGQPEGHDGPHLCACGDQLADSGELPHRWITDGLVIETNRPIEIHEMVWIKQRYDRMQTSGGTIDGLRWNVRLIQPLPTNTDWLTDGDGGIW